MFVPAVVGLFAVASLLGGCDEDSDSPGQPGDTSGVSVAIEPTAVSVGITETYSFTAVVTGGSTGAVDWYVGGVRSGDATVGTITQTNPATYTAPDGVPASGPVMVRAVSMEDSAGADSCQVSVTFTRVYVDADAGDDATGVGGKNKPFRTITKGLATADPGTRVIVAPGIYDDANGETFPIAVPDSVALEGEDWETCVIRVDAERLGVRTGVWLSCDDCEVRKFTLEEVDTKSDFWSYAIHLWDCNRARADSLRCLERAYLAVLRVERDHGSIVESCHFVVDDGSNDGRGLEIVFNEDNNGTILRDLTVSGYFTGIQFNFMQDTLVESCTLSGNMLGVNLCCYQDVNSQPNPDFGGGARGGAGGNDFSGNQSCGLNNQTANTVYAKNNTWGSTPPVEGTDYCNLDAAAGGSVITE